MKFSALLGAFCLLMATLTAAGNEEAILVDMQIDLVAWGDDVHGLRLGSLDDSEDGIDALSFRYGNEAASYSGSPLLAIYQSKGATKKEIPYAITPEGGEVFARPLVSESAQESLANGGKRLIPPLLAERRLKEPSLVALVELPLNARRVTLLLAPAAEGTYTGYVINDDPSRLPVGQLLVHNLCEKEIAMKFGSGELVVLKPSQSFLVKPADEYLTYTTYKLGYLNEGSWKIQETNVMRLSPEAQNQLIVVRNDNEFFRSSTGGRSGFLQTVTLRRRTQ